MAYFPQIHTDGPLVTGRAPAGVELVDARAGQATLELQNDLAVFNQ